MIQRIIAYALLLVAVQASGEEKPPNIVILYADDMGYGDVGAYNSESLIPTPNLDRLATEGMLFTDGHSSSGICTPSRYALLRGEHHWRRFHGIVNSFGESVFKPDDFTIAKMLNAAGYNTACVGKWHLGWNWNALKRENAPSVMVEQWGKKKKAYKPEAFDWGKPVSGGPLDQGFNYYFGDGTINFPPYCWVENDQVLEPPTVMMTTDAFKPIPEGNWEFRPGPMVNGWDPHKVLPTMTKRAEAWIQKQSSDKPFFLYFPLPSPHAPIIPNEEFVGKSKAGPYGDFVYESDAMIGKVLKALDDRGFSENTIVVFTSDNGPEKYAFDREKKYGHKSSGPLRGLKRDVWEGGHRVPFIIKWPGKVKAGSVSDETVSQVDLAATFASMLGYTLKKNEAIDSYNLMPVLEGSEYVKPLRKATVQNTFNKVFALRQGDWILIDGATGEHSKAPDWYNDVRGYEKQEGRSLLFNLRNDPAQQENLVLSQPEKAESMLTLLNLYREGKACAPHAQ